MSSVRLIIVPTSSRRAVPSVAQVSSLNVGRSRRVPRNRKGQSRRALYLLRGTGGSNPPPSTDESANPRSLSTSAIGVEGRLNTNSCQCVEDSPEMPDILVGGESSQAPMYCIASEPAAANPASVGAQGALNPSTMFQAHRGGDRCPARESPHRRSRRERHPVR
jgi:hypothetical protein